ncbi:hypothetical protein GPA10_39590 [Streptomyces sp. p1417]|uniref:Uncharacterized protein n=1 Tax=Streptomyces typhae TaxID=2681492 RepID=A0A6L6XAG5_9ACTN|nr:hypothetical protein [Streptomyces typhae]MVO90687.1 hypothetical protein [Streptomyces typhae]
MSATTAELNATATRVYATYTGHLNYCPPCQRTDYCPTGARLRRAWRDAQGAATRALRERTGDTR